MIINLCSVVTKNCLNEFLLTKYSCEKFNDCNWYVSCDTHSAEHLKQFKNIKIFTFEVDDSISDHNSTSPSHREQFLKIILNKFKVLEECLLVEKHALFLDSDMLFLNKIDTDIIKLLESGSVDFVVSPHYSRDPSNEDKHGHYNVGMFGLANSENLREWKYLTENCERFGLYYEQKPFELILSNFKTLNLPINYNIGWWRFNNNRTRDRIDKINLKESELKFGNLPAVNFHFHVFKSPNGYNPGGFLVDRVFKLLKNSNKKEYVDIVKHYETLSKKAI